MAFKGGGGSPPPPPKPPRPPAPPLPNDARESLENEGFFKRRKQAKGFASTVLTSGLGVQQPNTTLDNILGG